MEADVEVFQFNPALSNFRSGQWYVYRHSDCSYLWPDGVWRKRCSNGTEHSLDPSGFCETEEEARNLMTKFAGKA